MHQWIRDSHGDGRKGTNKGEREVKERGGDHGTVEAEGEEYFRDS